MNSQNKILYEHLKDYPTSSEAYHEISNRAVPAAWAKAQPLCCAAIRSIGHADNTESIA